MLASCSRSLLRRSFTEWRVPVPHAFRFASTTAASTATAIADAASSPFGVAIVGSGPSACYTAKYLKSTMDKLGKAVTIHMFERLSTPFGLVRFGVAPDHPEVKNVQNDFAKLFESKQVTFYGNVNVGTDVSVAELRDRFDAVVMAYGCESDRKLGLPGESTLDGVLSAREFVAWYNGHPDFEHVGDVVKSAISNAENSSSNIVIIGQGNVALDCARILAKTAPSLASTDIARDALSILKPAPTSSHERTVHVLGRRGHLQASFTIKELRELTQLEDECDASCLVRSDELDQGSTDASLEELQGRFGRPKKRIDALLQKIAEGASSPSKRGGTKTNVHLRFLMQPIEFKSTTTENGREERNKLQSVVFERTALKGEAGKQWAHATGDFETINADLALVSIGYKGTAIAGTEEYFDSEAGIMVNAAGRVDAAGRKGGLYVAGWLKRGPRGIIGTNINDAKETVNSIVSDFETIADLDRTSGSSPVQVDDMMALLNDRCKVVTWDMLRETKAMQGQLQHTSSNDAST